MLFFSDVQVPVGRRRKQRWKWKRPKASEAWTFSQQNKLIRDITLGAHELGSWLVQIVRCLAGLCACISCVASANHRCVLRDDGSSAIQLGSALRATWVHCVSALSLVIGVLQRWWLVVPHIHALRTGSLHVLVIACHLRTFAFT